MRLPAWPRAPRAEHDAEVWEALVKPLGEEEAALLVAEVAGVVIGLAEVYLRADAADPATIAHRYSYLQSLFLTAEPRGRGAGSELMAAAARSSRAHAAITLPPHTWQLAARPLAFYDPLVYQ